MNRGIAAVSTSIAFGIDPNGRLGAVLSDNVAPTSSDLVSLGQWTFVALTWDGSTLNYFIDGNPSGSFSFTGTASDPFPGTRRVDIGVDDQDVGWFNGNIDELRIYNRALTPEEITTLGGSHLFKATFRASCRTTNNLGVLVSRPMANRDLIRDCAEEHEITNIASLALVYDVFADEVQVVQASDGSRVCGVVSFQDGVSVQNANGTRRERHAFLFTEDNDQAIGSAVGTEQEVFDANGNLKKFKFQGDIQFGLSATETESARVCKGTFSTGAKFVPKNPAP